MHFLYVLPSNSGRVFSASKRVFLFFSSSRLISRCGFSLHRPDSQVFAETSLLLASINNLEGAMYIYAEACWGDFSRRDVGTKTSRWLHFCKRIFLKSLIMSDGSWKLDFTALTGTCVSESAVCWVEVGLNGFDVRRNRLNGSPQCASEQWFRVRGRHASRDYRLCDTLGNKKPAFYVANEQYWHY